MAVAEEAPGEIQTEMDAQTIALRVVAGILIVGAMSLLASLLVPFVLALVLATALSPLANRIERLGAGRSLSSAVCTLAVLAVLVGTVGLVAYQAGAILGQADQHIKGLSKLIARLSHSTGGDRVLESFGYMSQEDKGDDRQGTERNRDESTPRNDQPEQSASRSSSSGSGRGERPDVESAAYWNRLVHQSVSTLGQWLVRGLGGLLGLLGGTVIFLAFLFYMLETRGEWVDRVRQAMVYVGMRPRTENLVRVQHEIVTYFGCLSLVALGYTIIVSLALWAIGLPQPLLWGVMAGLLEFVPYFGPLIASALPTLVALSLGEGWWRPAAAVGLFVALHTIEGYVITPLLYGRAIKFNPVMILLGVLFFGWIWGPLGLTVAMPMMIMLRGLVAITPETPALDALINPETSAVSRAKG